jgi:hypothetical protein
MWIIPAFIVAPGLFLKSRSSSYPVFGRDFGAKDPYAGVVRGQADLDPEKHEIWLASEQARLANAERRRLGLPYCPPAS